MAIQKFISKSLKYGTPIVRNAGVGFVSGSLAGRFTASSEGARSAQRVGGLSGAIVGATTGLPFSKLAQNAQKFSRVYAAGLRSTKPASKTAKVIGAIDKGYTGGRVVFRRIRGRIIKIRVKG